jgi:hypothetical protein
MDGRKRKWVRRVDDMERARLDWQARLIADQVFFKAPRKY